jgi:hypothetical protein
MSMAGSTKILTVSYGAFSCTVEGFEDPLNVVRDVTQFFSGVARSDRFFGAEPWQHDPELAGEMRRNQISAEFDGVHLSLRRGGAPDVSRDDTSPAYASAPEAAAGDGAAGATTEPDGTAPTESVEPAVSTNTAALHPVTPLAPLANPHPSAERTEAASIADKLARIRALVAESGIFDAAFSTAEADTRPPADAPKATMATRSADGTEPELANAAREAVPENAVPHETAALDDIRDPHRQRDAQSRAAPLRLCNPILDDAAMASDGSVLPRSLRKVVNLSSPGRTMLTEGAVRVGDESRLLEQAESEMNKPECNRRRNAFAHLRAAVAAQRTDLDLRWRTQDDERAIPYRRTLASVVHTDRPDPTNPGTARTQAAPLLLLVQRGNVCEEVEPTYSACQRRVAPAGKIAPARGSDPDGFAAFAAEMGAIDLPDLLEAAAAYLVFVRGREKFLGLSVMALVKRADGGLATREERLRGFGRLLRGCKIEKAAGGRFAVTQRIRFRPGPRTAD